MKITAHILLIYFSIGACIPNCDFSQLLKLGNLMEHYDEHQEEALAIGETISFSEFLYIHFIDGDEHQHENEDHHENLPLQNITSPITFYLAINLPSLNTTTKVFTKTVLPFYPSILQDELASNIFHPPILA